jgi:hypothetical protein
LRPPADLIRFTVKAQMTGVPGAAAPIAGAKPKAAAKSAPRGKR